MIITPRVGIYTSIAGAVISVLLLCGTELTTLFGTAAETKILAALVIFGAIINGVNGVLHMIPAMQATTQGVANEFPLGPEAKK